ncbi:MULTISPECIES: formylglycine-generating enzyme family protein [unclassified Psychrobacter]|uniref:formylglycine-generating enzyme family protein n=1 Tax=unclassified Psychrobacter TaxID=196806 RepID=UPI0017880C4F|nr:MULTISPECIES: SUMF1/EgtB/PvdO family nonheme iron enzyme [unclassified Psychrobacter]MBE0443256.1 SUMF1/EgtB/PvdO family nonheme iron enzyme [Psychrobacter sp. FME13]
MTFKPLLLSLLISPLCTLSACANTPDTSVDNNGVPQTRSDLTDAEQKQLDDFVAKQKANMRFIEGGSYEMGDFGPKLDWTGGMPISSNGDNKTLHKVTLDSFSMNAYKATYGDFDIYSMATGQPKEGMQEYAEKVRQPNAAAGIDWQTAQHYCQWLGDELNVSMNLPTEAQWEYAARNRGQYVLFPTDTGDIDDGRNIWTFEQKQEIRSKYNTSLAVPIVGLYPPNPLGLYDMTNQNYEWMSDWYDDNYYAESPEHSPQGPLAGKEKVLRSVEANEGDASTIKLIGAVSVKRWHKVPNPPLLDNDAEINQNGDTSARCVANSPQAIS